MSVCGECMLNVNLNEVIHTKCDSNKALFKYTVK